MSEQREVNPEEYIKQLEERVEDLQEQLDAERLKNSLK
jgi:hypothetical protein